MTVGYFPPPWPVEESADARLPHRSVKRNDPKVDLVSETDCSSPHTLGDVARVQVAKAGDQVAVDQSGRRRVRTPPSADIEEKTASANRGCACCCH